jgi:hypothetical protein
MNRFVLGIVLGLAIAAAQRTAGQDRKSPEPDWQPALAYGGAPDCPEHLGSRTYRSAIARYSSTTVFITGTTVHKTSGCKAATEIQVLRPGKSSRFKLVARSESNFALIDFSPDGQSVLLAHDYNADELRQYREVSISLMRLANGRVDWHNTWDPFGWKDCDAMVEPQGFLSDGRIIIRARQTVMAAHTHANCV